MTPIRSTRPTSNGLAASRTLALCACIAVCALGWSGPQPIPQTSIQPAAEPPPSTATDTTPPRTVPSDPPVGLAVSLAGGLAEDLAERLASLRPSDPEAYLRLGEDVAEQATDARGRDLARTLYTLAFILDRRRTEAMIFPTATSACLALAQMSPNDHQRAWLVALAHAIDPRMKYPDWSRSEPPAADSNTSYLAAVYVGLVRAGDSVRARRVIDSPGVRDLIRRYERLLSPINDTGGLNELEREMARWPCPECAGKRIVRRYQTNPPQFRVCSVCRGTLGPTLKPEILAAHLRFESRMLSGTARSWSAQVISDGGAPLRDADPGDLPAVMNVDPEAVLWRQGRWIAPGRDPG